MPTPQGGNHPQFFLPSQNKLRAVTFKLCPIIALHWIYERPTQRFAYVDRFIKPTLTKKEK